MLSLILFTLLNICMYILTLTSSGVVHKYFHHIIMTAIQASYDSRPKPPN